MQKFDTSYLTKLNKMLQKANVINLAVGQPDFKPPTSVVKAMREGVEEYTGYTPLLGLPELRELIKKKLSMENKVGAEEVVVTAGAVEAIFDTMLTHLTHNSEVILFSPYYEKYIMAPALLGAKIKTVPLKKNRPDMVELERQITEKTGMVIVNSPSNPTGMVYSEEEIKHLVEIIDRHDLILLSDEAYERYVYGHKEHISPGRFSDKVITVNSFSKTYGFPGLRLGYLAGKQELVEPTIDIHVANTTCCPYATQMAAIEALRGKCPVNLRSFDERRKLVMRHLDSVGADYIYPEGAFYVYVYTATDSMNISNILMKKEVLVMPSTLFGGQRNALRISYAIEHKMLEKGLSVLMPFIGEA